MDIKDLKKIGLTEGEIRIYDALLDLGESTRTVLAKKSGVSPSKIYDVANRLLEKGIISSVKKDGIIHFRAANPYRINYFIEQKEDELKKEKLVAKQIMPILLLKFNQKPEDIDVEVFQGWEGMKTAYMDMAREISRNGLNYVFGASMGKDPKRADRLFEEHNKRMSKKNYKLRIIFNEDMRNYAPRIKKYLDDPNHKVRFLHQETFIEFNFYEDTVLFVVLLQKPIVIRVRSEEVVDAFKKYFKTMWNRAKG